MEYKRARRAMKRGAREQAGVAIRREVWPTGWRLEMNDAGIQLNRDGDLGPYAPTPGDGGEDGSDWRSEDEKATDWVVV